MAKFISVTGIVILLAFIVLCLIWILLARPALLQKQEIEAEKIIVDDQLLYQHVNVLSVDYAPRDFEHLANLNAVADYIVEQLEGIGLEVTEQTYSIENIEYKNIITSMGPEHGPKLVIGAHYDVAGAYPGADDNASGVAGLIELARLLKSQSLKKNITLVAYTLEEPPYFATHAMGSYVHAKNELKQGSDIELMISLEMIGYFSEEKDSQTFPLKILTLFYPAEGNFIAIVDQLFSGWARKIKTGMSRHTSLPVYSINAPASIPGIDFSDHRSYWEHGYDAVMITDTSFYRNFAYHTPEDTLDRLDYIKMAEVVQAVFGYVKELANKK